MLFRSPATQPNLRFLARQLADFAVGMQAVDTHDLAMAEESSARFDAELWRMSSQPKGPSAMEGMAANTGTAGPPKLQVMPDALLQPILSTLSVMSLEMRASVLLAQNQPEQSKKLFAQAEQEEKALGYREPPAYIRPVGEAEGAALLSIGDWADAKQAYEKALIERPKSGFSLYGIALSSEQSGDVAAASVEYSSFLTAWKVADSNLPQVAHARTFISQHASRSGQPGGS